MLSERESNQSGYNFSKDLTLPIRHTSRKQSKITKTKNSKANNERQDKGFYFNIKIIRKVATFLQNIKSTIVREKEELQPLQAFYLQNDDNQHQSSEYLISWQNPILLAFELVFLVIIIGCLWMNSYQLVFGIIQGLNDGVNGILLGLYILYVAIYLNTQLKNQKLQIVDSRRVILASYVTSKLPYDFIICLGIILQLAQVQWAFYPSRIMTSLIVIQFRSLMNKFENKFAVSIEVESIISIFKLLSKIVIFIHLLSLTFNAMSMLQKSKGIRITWIQKQNLQNSSLFQLYIYGWYWASTIIATVGFGDITPANVYQCGFISIIQLLCSVMLGYSVNYIGTMIGVFGQSKATYQKDIRRLNKYLKTLTIPTNLSNGIRSHLFNKYQIQQVYDAQSEHYLFMKLTEKLRTEVRETNNLSILKKCKILSVFSDETLHRLAGVMRKTVYAPSEILFDETSETTKLFIIQQGRVNELINKCAQKQKPIQNYDDQQNTIGWMNLVTGNAYESCVRAQTYTITYQISRQQFMNVLKKDYKDYSKIIQIKEHIIQKPIKFIKKCLVCGRLTHSVVDCPKIHFQASKMQTLLIRQKKQSLFMKSNRRNRGYIRNERKNKRIFANQTERQIDQICQQDTNRFSFHQVKWSPDILQKQQKNINKQGGISLRVPNKKKTTIFYEIGNRPSHQLKTAQEFKNIQESRNSKKLQVSSKRIADEIGFKVSNKEIKDYAHEYLNNNQIYPEINEQLILKNMILARFDKILADKNDQFYPNNQISNILKLMQFQGTDTIDQNLNNKKLIQKGRTQKNK